MQIGICGSNYNAAFRNRERADLTSVWRDDVIPPEKRRALGQNFNLHNTSVLDTV